MRLCVCVKGLLKANSDLVLQEGLDTAHKVFQFPQTVSETKSCYQEAEKAPKSPALLLCPLHAA